MSRKRLRLYLVLATLVVLGIAATLILRALNEELVFFRSPTEVTTNRPDAGSLFRLGGLVETGTVEKQGEQVSFSVTDHRSGRMPSSTTVSCPPSRDARISLAMRFGPAG